MTTTALIASELVAALERTGIYTVDRRGRYVDDSALEKVVDDLLVAGTIRPPAVTESGGARADSTTPSGDEVLEQLEQLEPTVRLALAVERLGAIVEAGVGLVAAWASIDDRPPPAPVKPDTLVDCPVDHSTVDAGAACPLCAGAGRVPNRVALKALGQPDPATVDEVEH